LVLNPSVEIGETGAVTPQDWFSSEIGTEWSTAYARTGAKSLRINIINATAEWIGKVTSVHEGYTYGVYGFFRGEVTANQFLLTVKWFSDLEGLNLIAESNTPISVGNYTEWSRLGAVFTAPKETKSCEIVFRAVNSSGDMYGDDFEVRRAESLTSFINGLTMALVIYIISYYIIKWRFIYKVEKQQKLLTTGIGIYFLSWIVSWVLLYTIIAWLLSSS